MEKNDVKTDVKTAVLEFIEPQVKISRTELLGKLFCLNGAEIVTIYTKTYPKMLVKSRKDKMIKNPYALIGKVSKVNGLFNVNYANCVNNQLARETEENDFKSAKRKWELESYNGSNVIAYKVDKDGNPEFDENGNIKLYLQFNPRNHYYTKYVDGLDNQIKESKIEDFLPKKSSSSRQGTDKEIIWRTYKVQSITAIKMEKVLYVIGK